jgi:hypothetical protein
MNNNTDKDALYYTDPNGLLVFTEKYHLERGYCCKNGCRHCPYTEKKKIEQKIKLKVNENGGAEDSEL